jgi:phosphoglucomutase
MSNEYPRAGKPAEKSDLIDVQKVLNKYYELKPDVDNPSQKVTFGTSGHRGSSLNAAFNEAHIVAMTQAIIEWRKSKGFGGPVFVGYDTHCLSIPAFRTTVEILVANDVQVMIDSRNSFVPTPAVSHAILRYNEGKTNPKTLADGIVITPSHNPPMDGGYKYNPPDGGPAGTDITGPIEARANEILRQGWHNIPRVPFTIAKKQDLVIPYDYRKYYVDDLTNIIDLEAIKNAGIHIGADPLGGASVEYWGVIAEQYGLNLDVVNPKVDPQWGFMTLDWDEKIRMDCSSPFAMASLTNIMETGKYDIATGNDADSDRHGIVTKDRGLMNPNHFLAVCIDYLIRHRDWNPNVKIGKTLVSSRLIDLVVKDLGKELYEVPVGFKYFVDGLVDGSVAFGGEESAGASFLRKNGKVWTTDKDGLILDLLAAEIMVNTGKSPSELHTDLSGRLGESWYKRIDAPASLDEKSKLKSLTPEAVTSTSLAGEPIARKLTTAPGNNEAIGGLKVETASAWFTARPSGTENVYKIYAESFKSEQHLAEVQEDAKLVVAAALK